MPAAPRVGAGAHLAVVPSWPLSHLRLPPDLLYKLGCSCSSSAHPKWAWAGGHSSCHGLAVTVTPGPPGCRPRVPQGCRASVCPVGHQNSVSAVGGEQGALPFPTPGRPWRRRCSLQGRAQAGGQAPSSHSLAASHWVAWGGAVAALRPGCCDSLLSFCRMDVAELMPADCLWWVAPWKFAD